MSVTATIIRHIEGLGYTVEVGTFGYRIRMVATGPDGQRYVVNADDEYQAACELAQLVGIELEDG